ncbi:MAG: hypothetical protein J6N95_06265 [Bacilli bacterium]|nr:hypothetical protein [Bacilli bacterium]
MLSKQKMIILSMISVIVVSCSNKKPLTLEERLHEAYLDVIEQDEKDIRPLVSITKEEKNIDWNDEGDRVLLFTFHRFPTSYPEGEEITFTWNESWLCSVKEYKNWYLSNKTNINDHLLRTKQVLGMSHESKNTYITSMWLKPADLKRPGYVTDITKPMALSFSENETEEYKTWFNNQYYYSYDVSKLPWTRLGYTYDWSEEAKDKYGLTEFIAFKGTKAIVDKTLQVEDFLKSFNVLKK